MSSRCASTIQIVCPLESMTETQPRLHPALGIVDTCGAGLLASSRRFAKILGLTRSTQKAT